MRNGDGVREERSEWRDEWISQRHRQWGYDCPAADIDFLVVEYHLAVPVAIVDYKGFQPRPLDTKSTTFRALRWLADMCGILFMVVFYQPQNSVFTVLPMNERAKRRYQPYQVMSEREYVETLYEMRRLSVPQQIFARLSTFKPRK